MKGLAAASGLLLASLLAAVVVSALSPERNDELGRPAIGDPGAPRIGRDHWHAVYSFYACGERQPNSPTWEGGGVHTHGDGIVHIHPFTQAEEGRGARLIKWFEYGGGLLDGDEIRLPGLGKTWKNGETCPDGTPDEGEEGVVQVFVNTAQLDDWTEYIPQDGDVIWMSFGKELDEVPLDASAQ